MKVRRRGLIWAVAALAAAPVAMTLPGCGGGGSNSLTLPGQAGNGLANRVFLGSYSAAAGLPAGSFRLTFNAHATGGTFEFFDPALGTTSGNFTVTDNSNGTVTVTATTTPPPPSPISKGRSIGTRAFATGATITIQTNDFDAIVNRVTVNGQARAGNAAVAPDASSNPLAGRTFEADFGSGYARGHYKVVVAGNGTDLTITGNAGGPQPGSLLGTFAGTGTVGAPSAPGLHDNSLTATATITSGVFNDQIIGFNGKITILTSTSVTIGGDVFVNQRKVTTFAATAAIPDTAGGGGGSDGTFTGARIPTFEGAGYTLSNPHFGRGFFHVLVTDTSTILTIEDAQGDIKRGQAFTGGLPNGSGDFTLNGNTGSGSAAAIKGRLTKSGSTVTLSNFSILIDGQTVGHLTNGTTVTGSILTVSSIPLRFAVGSYSGTVKNTDESGSPTVADIHITLNCQRTGTAHFTVTAPGATFQNSANNTSKELDGNVTGYESYPAAISVTVTGFDTRTNSTVSIIGSVKVVENGGTNLTASGDLTDTEGEHFAVTLNQFTPEQTDCD